MIEWEGADWIVESMPSKFRPRVLASKYGYVAIGRWTFSKIWLWLAQVGLER